MPYSVTSLRDFVDLFISFKLIFVKSFLADIPTLGHGRGDDDEKDPNRREL